MIVVSRDSNDQYTGIAGNVEYEANNECMCICDSQPVCITADLCRYYGHTGLQGRVEICITR